MSDNLSDPPDDQRRQRPTRMPGPVEAPMPNAAPLAGWATRICPASRPSPSPAMPRAQRNVLGNIRGGLRAVIFDKDGTLFNFQATWGAWCTGMIEAEAGGDPHLGARIADALGYDPVGRRFRPDSVIAEPTEMLAERLLPLLPEARRAGIVARMNQRAAAAPQVEAAPLGDLLAGLACRGLRLGLATNDVEASTRAHLRAAGIEDLFDSIVCLDSGWGAKPQPGQLLAVARALGLEPEQCVMVGDSLHDLHAARAAGMAVVAVLTGLTPRDALEPVADAVLGSIGDLPGWLAPRSDGAALRPPERSVG